MNAVSGRTKLPSAALWLRSKPPMRCEAFQLRGATARAAATRCAYMHGGGWRADVVPVLLCACA